MYTYNSGLKPFGFIFLLYTQFLAMTGPDIFTWYEENFIKDIFNMPDGC